MPVSVGLLEIIGASLFALAVLHTFSTRYFEHLAHTRTAHSGVWHLLGEVEAVFGFWAFVLVLLAENARIPVDNPATHLELTMIHEAMLLEYSARHLALMEWAAALKLFNYACIGFALFLPWGLATGDSPNPGTLLASFPVLVAKLVIAGAALALIETVSAKLRVFRAPEFLATAFLLAVLGLLVHLLLGA